MESLIQPTFHGHRSLTENLQGYADFDSLPLHLSTENVPINSSKTRENITKYIVRILKLKKLTNLHRIANHEHIFRRHQLKYKDSLAMSAALRRFLHNRMCPSPM